MCGRYFTRKFLAWFGFFFCVAYVAFVLIRCLCLRYACTYTSVGIVLVFTIPRVPGFRFNQDTPLTNASVEFNSTVTTQFTRAPANFSFPASADIQIDTSSNFLPLTFHKLHATIYDLSTLQQVGTGDLGHMTLPAKALTTVFMPLNFSYVTSNDSDATCTVPRCSHSSKC